MRVFFIFISLIVLGSFGKARAQDLCGQRAYMQYLDSIHPGFSASVENTFFTALKQSKIKTKKEQDTIFKINVVFHVVYNNDQQNIDDSLIFSQLKVMNDAFRRTNADTINTRDIFKPVAADAGIEFVMATLDPDGNPSNGIVRKETVRQTFGTSPTNLSSSDLVKNGNVGSAPWDTEKYLNIWICDLSANGVDALLGYAYPPTGADNWNGNGSFTTADKQGVVCHYKVVGENNPESTATGSKTMVHEVGHYLGLRHIWGDGGCGVDDFMDDTPLARRASNGCNKGVNTCTEAIGEQFPDMLENYMDYSSDECQNLFTNDQVAQMRTNLRMFRSGIYEEQVPVPPAPAFSLEKSGVYPNPVVDGTLNIYIKEVDANSVYEIAIFNTLGQQVFSSELAAVQSQKISGFMWLHGAYIFRLKKGDEVITSGKLLMQN